MVRPGPKSPDQNLDDSDLTLDWIHQKLTFLHKIKIGSYIVLEPQLHDAHFNIFDVLASNPDVMVISKRALDSLSMLVVLLLLL